MGRKGVALCRFSPLWWFCSRNSSMMFTWYGRSAIVVAE